VYGENKFHSILSLEGLEKHAIVIDSISKRYSACGARIGMLVSRNPEVMDAALRFAQARLSPPTLEQILGEATLDVPDSYLADVNREYDARRRLLVERIQAIPGVVCPNPGGAFYVLVRLPVDDADTFCRWMLESFDHQGETVMMAPGSGFYATPGLGRQEARLAYVLKQEDLERAVECLAKGLEAYNAR
jgi:aspartate aminotransferase